MPFLSKEARAEYYRSYRQARLDAIRARQADWFQENKERLTRKHRKDRHAKAAAEAMALLHSMKPNSDE